MAGEWEFLGGDLFGSHILNLFLGVLFDEFLNLVNNYKDFLTPNPQRSYGLKSTPLQSQNQTQTHCSWFGRVVEKEEREIQFVWFGKANWNKIPLI